jgi:hypothetical protein
VEHRPNEEDTKVKKRQRHENPKSLADRIIRRLTPKSSLALERIADELSQPGQIVGGIIIAAFTFGPRPFLSFNDEAQRTAAREARCWKLLEGKEPGAYTIELERTQDE